MNIYDNKDEKGNNKKRDDDMATLCANKSLLSTFIKQNKAKIYNEARKNTILNSDNKPTISSNDEWFNENEWDKDNKTAF